MLYSPYFIFFLLLMNTMVLFDFNKNSTLSEWAIVDDGVMGGRSSGSLSINAEGHGVFKGYISLENNGGFSSVRYRFDTLDIKNHNTFVMRLKGDGKKYQFRLKSNASDYYSYITYIETSGDWQTVEISTDKFYPSFRGRKLNLPIFQPNN